MFHKLRRFLHRVFKGHYPEYYVYSSPYYYPSLLCRICDDNSKKWRLEHAEKLRKKINAN